MSAKRKKRAGLSIMVIIVLIICIVVMYKQSDLDKEYQENLNKYEQLREAYAEEERRAVLLERESDYRNTDSYIEDIARKVLGLVYEDELVFKSTEE